MKTIEVPDSIYDRLKAIADEISTQDSRATARPYLFQIRTDEKVHVPDLNGDFKCIISRDCEEVGPFSYPVIADIALNRDVELPDHIKSDDDVNLFSRDVYDWLEENGSYRVESYSIKHRLENAFFTAKGCQAHIKGNGHHYSNPKDYLSYAFRNPEMAVVFELFDLLAGIPEQP